MICPNCQKEIADHSNFCYNCGARLVAGAPAPPAYTAPAAKRLTHSAGGYMAVNNYEFPLVLATACFALATVGAGRASVDYALYESGGGRPRPGKPKGKP